MQYTYKTKGTCASEINFDVKDDCVYNVSYTGGCNGNLKAIGRLVEGKDAKDIACILKGNQCGPRPTSCADQLARAIEEVL